MSEDHESEIVDLARLVLREGSLRSLKCLDDASEENCALLQEVVLVLIELDPEKFALAVAATLTR